MHKTFLLTALILSFILCNVVSAETYIIRQGDTYLHTRTFSDNIQRTHISFVIGDSDDYNFPVIDSVVNYVTLTDPNGNTSEPYPYVHDEQLPFSNMNKNISDIQEDVVLLSPYYIFEHRMTDNNPQDGIINPFMGEFKKRASSGWEHSLYTQSFPITGGDYTFTVYFTDGTSDTQTIYVPPGEELRPVENVRAEFCQDEPCQVGRLYVRWDLDDAFYNKPEYQDATLQIRVDRFSKDGSKKHHRFRIQNLPLFINGVPQEEHPLMKYASDLVRITPLYPYIKVQVRIYSQYKNCSAVSDYTDFKIDGYTVTPTTIPEPSNMSQEEVEEAIAEACPGNSEYKGRPESPGKSDPPGQKKDLND